MKKKNLIITILLLTSVLGLSACQKSYKPDRSYMSPEQIEKEQNLLDEFKGKLDTAENNADKITYSFEIAFRYQTLGDYDNAIKYYEEVLELDGQDKRSLNNLAVMYEEMDDIPKALEYEQKLYNIDPINTEAVEDTIRLLVKNKQFSDAEGVVMQFANSSKGEENAEFIGGQFAYIKEEKDKDAEK